MAKKATVKKTTASKAVRKEKKKDLDILNVPVIGEIAVDGVKEAGLGRWKVEISADMLDKLASVLVQRELVKYLMMKHGARNPAIEPMFGGHMKFVPDRKVWVKEYVFVDG